MGHCPRPSKGRRLQWWLKSYDRYADVDSSRSLDDLDAKQMQRYSKIW